MKTNELKDLVVSALVLALAFGIAFSGGWRAILQPATLALTFFLSLIAVSLGFILHEMGHRFVARKFNCFAEYKMWPLGLLAAIVFSLFGFVLAAPGAVQIYPGIDQWGRATLTRKKIGLISISGPTMNLCLALVFIVLNSFYPHPAFYLGAQINTWLAVFNLIPFGPLDGLKIFSWDKRIWSGAVIAAIGLFVLESLIF